MQGLERGAKVFNAAYLKKLKQSDYCGACEQRSLIKKREEKGAETAIGSSVPSENREGLCSKSGIACEKNNRLPNAVKINFSKAPKYLKVYIEEPVRYTKPTPRCAVAFNPKAKRDVESHTAAFVCSPQQYLDPDLPAYGPTFMETKEVSAAEIRRKMRRKVKAELRLKLAPKELKLASKEPASEPSDDEVTSPRTFKTRLANFISMRDREVKNAKEDRLLLTQQFKKERKIAAERYEIDKGRRKKYTIDGEVTPIKSSAIFTKGTARRLTQMMQQISNSSAAMRPIEAQISAEWASNAKKRVIV